ncbi:MAG: hypothetical protein AAFX78_03610 [Cyanobacteria bacterium J06638_20]
MPWIEPSDCPDYLFLDTGELQYRDRFGRYQIAGGCVPDNWFQFLDLRDQAISFLGEASEVSPEQIYIESQRFCWLCDRCLTYSGITPEDVSPRQVIRLLFARQDGDTLIPAPLATLSEPPPRRHPPLPNSDGQVISDKASLIAALISQGETESLLAMPMREALAVADDLAWAATPKKERDKATMRADAKRSMSRIDDFLANGLKPQPQPQGVASD